MYLCGGLSGRDPLHAVHLSMRARARTSGQYVLECMGTGTIHRCDADQHGAPETLNIVCLCLCVCVCVCNGCDSKQLQAGGDQPVAGHKLMSRGALQAVVINLTLDTEQTQFLGVHRHVCEIQLLLDRLVPFQVCAFSLTLSHSHSLSLSLCEVQLLLNRQVSFECHLSFFSLCLSL